MLTRLRALDVSEERALAGKLAGALYLTGSLSFPVFLVLPGAVDRHFPVVIALSAFGALWALVCFTVIPWERAHPLISHLSSAMGFPIVAMAMAATGGAQSPARFYLFFTVVYCSYFYPRREAMPYLLACGLVHALPLAYDPGAVEAGLIPELAIAAPTYFVLGSLILAGKALLVDLREQAHQLSLLDPLTELANRRALMSRLECQLGGERASDSVGLLLVDLDGFKDANTMHGHPGGDHALRRTAQALRGATRGDDLVARLGGDEFAIVSFAASEAGMASLARRVLGSVRAANEGLNLPGFTLSASVGWALYPDNSSSVDDLVAAADGCMRAAKADGEGAPLHPAERAPARTPA